jgi:hypothetical protein
MWEVKVSPILVRKAGFLGAWGISLEKLPAEIKGSPDANRR